MQLCFAHADDASSTQCARRSAPNPQGQGSPCRHVALGLRPRRAPPPGRTAHARRASAAPCPTKPGAAARGGRPSGSGRAALAMIVVDASVAIEVLLQTPAGRDLTPRLLDSNETLH